MGKVFTTTNKNIPEVVEEMVREFNREPRVILYYTSVDYDLQELAIALKESFPFTLFFGCTHIGAFGDGKTIENGIVAMDLDVDDIYVDFVEPTDESLIGFIERVKKHYNQEDIRDLNMEEYVGLTLLSPFNDKQEEYIMEKLGDKTDLVFIGGSSADNLTFTGTYAYINERVKKNGNIVAVIKTKNGYGFMKSQSVVPIKRGLTVTKLGDNHRVIKEIDNRPALEVYCEVTGLSKEEVSNKMKSYPFGLIIDEEMFVRSPQAIINGTEIALYCEIKEGTEIAILKSLKDRVLDETTEVYNNIATTGQCLVFNCILRKLELQEESKLDEYHKNLNKIDTIGFHTYGEQMVGHINQTATMLILY
ncbi:MAG: FIST N-terminal domain-containing protein [Candidatus Anstonellales archaeon]